MPGRAIRNQATTPGPGKAVVHTAFGSQPGSEAGGTRASTQGCLVVVYSMVTVGSELTIGLLSDGVQVLPRGASAVRTYVSPGVGSLS